MKVEEKTKYQLLQEIHEECEAQHLKYFLLDHELLCYERKTKVYSCEADICMMYSEFRKLQKGLRKRKRKNRFFETIYNNHNMPCVYCRYVYTKSLAYRPEYHAVRKAMGISVNIHILRECSQLSDKLFDIERHMCMEIESGVQARTGNIDTRMFQPKTTLFALKVDRLLRNAALTEYSSRSTLFIPECGQLFFPENFFDKYVTLNIAGYDFHTVSDIKGYLKIRYGDDYENRSIINMQNHYMVIVDNGIKYKRIVPILNRDKMFNNEFWVRRNRFLKNYTESYCKMEEKEKEIYSYFYCEEARFRLWKQYYWQRDDLLSLYSQGRFDELWMRFRNYNVEVMRGIKQGYVPIFDDELYELYRKLCSEYLSSELQERIDQVLLDRPIPELDGERIGEYYTADMCRNAYKTRCI